MADIKAAIREVREQLFLDQADQKYLSNVTANLNFERPLFGFGNDSLWRAIVRRFSLDYRQIANLFYDLLTEMFGPHRTVANVLSVDGLVLDEAVTVPIQQAQHRHAIQITSRTLPQRGTLVIDEGLTTEESVQYSFRDPRTGEIDLLTPLTKAHTALVTNASGYLKSDVASSVGATTLPLDHTIDFPTSGFPYPILIAPGTPEEEVTMLTGNNPTTNVLTVASLANYHYGFRETSIISHIVSITGSDAHVIRIQDSSQFPEEGWIKVQQDVLSGFSEKVEYIDNDVDTGTLTLSKKLGGSYTLPPSGSVTVSVLEPVSSVQLAQVQVKGADWDIFQTEQNVLKIYIPNDLLRNTLRDVSFLHDVAVLPTPTSALRSSALIGDLTLKATIGGTDAFPKSGILIVNPSGGNEEKVCYTRIDGKSSAKLYADGGGSIAIGTVTLLVDDITPIAAFDTINREKKLVLGRNRGTPNEEVVYYDSLDEDNNIINLRTSTLKVHYAEDLVTPLDGDTFYLTTGVVNAHSASEPLSLYQPVYVGTGTVATGTLVVPAGSAIKDGDFFVLDDGINPPYTYEFDNNSILNYVGRTPITFIGSETAAQIRDLIIAAVNGTSILITASNGGAATVALTHDNKGTVGNRPIQNWVESSIFVASGMSDGTDPLWDGRIFNITGQGDSFSVSLGIVTLTDAGANFPPLLVGNSVTISDATSSGNEGTFVVLSVPSPTQITYANALGVSEAFSGTWKVAVVKHLFQGHYLYDPGSPAIETTSTTLESNVAGPQMLEVTQHNLRSTLEVADAAYFNALGDFNVTIRGGGASETVDVQRVILRRVGPIWVTSNTSAGAYTIPLTGAGLLPAPSAGPPYGYRIIFDRNGANQEIAMVVSTAVGSCTLESATTITHLAGESVELMADVIVLSQSLEFDHEGRIPWNQRLWAAPGPLTDADKTSLVYEERRWIEVASLSGFPPVGSRVVINFGRGKIPVESVLQINHSAGGGSLVLASTAKFPTSGYPYFVEIDVDASSIAGFTSRANVKETIAVSLNDPSTATLTLVSVLKESHLKGSRVTYTPGPAAAVTYSSTLTGPTRLVFRNSARFDKSHVKGEVVALSGIQSLPSTKGSDYGFYLPSTWTDRLQYLFNRGRAAGVEVVVINDK